MMSRARLVTASSLALATIFAAALYASKETPAIYSHAPWLNDPYDTAVSFALFCMPLILAPSAVRLLAAWQLPDREAPERLADLLRACGVAIVVVALTLAACWAAVAAGANRAAWNSMTAAQVAALALFSVGIPACGVAIRRAGSRLQRDAAVKGSATQPAPDWLGDMIGVGRLLARLGGPAGRPVTLALDWTDVHVTPLVRRHPVGTAAVLASVIGLLVTISQAVNEGYGPVVAAVFFGIVTAGVFAFVATAGWYLRVIRTEQPARRRRPVLLATVLGTAAVPVALAFRSSLWSLVGVHPRSGVHELLLLLASAALLAFGAGLAGERIARSRREPADPPER